MIVPWFTLLDPVSRKSLRFIPIGEESGVGYLTDEDGSQRWPVALGIAFLRADRVDLANSVVSLILSAEHAEALGRLLQDTDDFAPQKPALEDCIHLAARLLANDGELVAREMMEVLKFGPVIDYFALRGSAPTFFSGLGLLKIGATRERPIIEVGCGVGHFLHWLHARGSEVLGTDTVFSKLCLAHRFMGVSADRLICAAAGKASSLPLATSGPTQVFCHDAFYFIEDKTRCLEDFRRLANPDGALLIGHAHLSSADHGIVSGYPVALDIYRQLAAAKARFFEDSALVAVGAGTGALVSEISVEAEAIAFIEGKTHQDATPWLSNEDILLHSPLEVTWSPIERHTTMNWPSAAFAEEYRSADYLQSSENPFEHLPVSNVDPQLLHPGLAIPGPFLALGVKPLRWGIIGGGWIATDYFTPAFPYLPHTKLVALAESNDERRSALAKNPRLRVFADWREMLTTCQLDAIYIATPNDSHAEIIEGVAAAGLRVLCEKPVATNLHDLDRIRRCSSMKPDFFQTAYDQRYHPAHLRLAKRISEGILGTVTQIRVHYACWVDDGWNKVSATDNWRIDRSRAGGGAGFDLLPHCLDLVSMLVADSIVDTHLLYQGRVHDYAIGNQVDDGALMSARTASGILVSFHVGYNCPEDQPRRRVEIIGTQGRVEALNTMGQDPGGELIWQTATGETREPFPTSAETGPFVRQLDAVSRLWLRGDVPQFPFQQDLDLAERLIHCDAQARSNSNLQS